LERIDAAASALEKELDSSSTNCGTRIGFWQVRKIAIDATYTE